MMLRKKKDLQQLSYSEYRLKRKERRKLARELQQKNTAIDSHSIATKNHMRRCSQRHQVSTSTIATQTEDEELLPPTLPISVLPSREIPEGVNLECVLEVLGLKTRCFHVFLREDIDLDALRLLDMTELKELGMSVGVRVKLMDVIRAFREGEAGDILVRAKKIADAMGQEDDDEEESVLGVKMPPGLEKRKDKPVDFVVGHLSPEGQEGVSVKHPSRHPRLATSHVSTDDFDTSTADEKHSSSVMMYYAGKDGEIQGSAIDPAKAVHDREPFRVIIPANSDRIHRNSNYHRGENVGESHKATAKKQDFTKLLSQARRSIGRHLDSE